MTLFDKIGYVFKNTDLFRRALTHKSYHNENLKGSIGHNERLEFLGDSVLDLALSAYLMQRFPDLDEGELSKIRASLVNENSLSEIARELTLDEHLLLGKGEKLTAGHTKPRLLACGLEALLGAIFLDSDFVTVDVIVKKIFDTRIEALDLSIHFKADYKTRLQEKLQSTKKVAPVYEIETEEGPDHDKKFFVLIKVADQIVARGQGRSKKQAEQEAARLAMEALEIV